MLLSPFLRRNHTQFCSERGEQVTLKRLPHPRVVCEGGHNAARIYQSVIPTSSASTFQCRGCGRRRPARIATAEATETPSADMITGFAIPASSGRILFV